jgi:NitT/TauT family transport system substrate-binding protein
MHLDRTRRLCLLAASVWPLASGLSACNWGHQPLLRVGLHTWPGYEFLHLARDLGQLDDQRVRLVQGPSASTTLRALSINTIEAGCLTLDEVLSARDRGTALTVLAVLNDSLGADTVLARPPLRELGDLKGRRIGVEKSAVGAVMLDATLRVAGLQPGDVQSVYLSVDEHVKAFREGRVDALVTYEPHKTRLMGSGAVELFSTRQAPGLVVDVLAVRTEHATTFLPQLRHALDAHFHALGLWQATPRKYDAFLGQRLQVDPREVAATYAELKLPDRAENRAWLGGSDAPAMANAQRLSATMVQAGLLRRSADLAGLFATDAL